MVFFLFFVSKIQVRLFASVVHYMSALSVQGLVESQVSTEQSLKAERGSYGCPFRSNLSKLFNSATNKHVPIMLHCGFRYSAETMAFSTAGASKV